MTGPPLFFGQCQVTKLAHNIANKRKSILLSCVLCFFLQTMLPLTFFFNQEVTNK